MKRRIKNGLAVIGEVRDTPDGSYIGYPAHWTGGVPRRYPTYSLARKYVLREYDRWVMFGNRGNAS